MRARSAGAAVFAITGGRIAGAFGAIVFVLVFLIAALQVASRQALHDYVEDQLARLPWDVSVYQPNDLASAQATREAIARVDGVREVAELHFLRTMVPTTTVGYVDGEPLRTPWMSLLAASDASLLPPEARPRAGGAVLVLVGSQSQMGEAFARLQGGRRFELRRARAHRSERVFDVAVERVVRLERADINRWFLEQTSSPTLVPELGLVIAVGADARLASAFDAVSRGIALHDHEHGGDATRLGPADDVHGDAGQYFPDIVHLVRLDRARLADGWKPQAGLARVQEAGEAVRAAAEEVSLRVGLDNNAAVLLERMAQTARRVGLIALLAALPLAWMAWVLMAQVAALLLLNARRLWGLLRLRGTPARTIASAVLGAVALGAAAGAIAGGVAGTVAPLALSAGAGGVARAFEIVDFRFVAIAAAIGIGIALWVSRRLVAFAMHVSPLEAAARIAASEARHARVRFGATGAALLAIGAAKVAQWIAAGAGLDVSGPSWWRSADRILDFAAYPFLVYGLTALVASRPAWLHAALAPFARLFGGPMSAASLRHFAARPHRAAAVVLVLALAASLCLYPTVLTAVFDDKIERAAQAQLAAPLHVTLAAPDLVDARDLARGPLAERHAAVASAAEALRGRIERLPEVKSVGVVAEALVDGLYIRGQGFNSTPLYLVDGAQGYLARFRHEDALAEDRDFTGDMGRVDDGAMLASAALRDYLRGGRDTVPAGRDVDGRMVSAPVGGVVRMLPGVPAASVAARDSFSGVRVDYLNHLFDERAYLVASAANPRLARLEVLIPRIALAIEPRPGVDEHALRAAVLAALPARPLEVRTLAGEVERLGSDMYVFLARENVRVYLAGGLVMALIGLAAVALANFADDRRTLALLRVRGARRREVLRFLAASLTAPAFAGMAIGVPVALVVGYGITHVIWALRELKTVLVYLPSHLAASAATAWVAAALAAGVLMMSAAVGRWVFRRTARAALEEH